VQAFAADVVVEEPDHVLFDEVSQPHAENLFVSDTMDIIREADEGGSVPLLSGYHGYSYEFI